MKVIFFIGQLGLGGGERQLYLLLKNLDRNKIGAYVVCFNEEGKYWDQPIRDLGVPVHILSSRNPFLRILSLTKLVCEIRPQVALSWDIQTNPYLALLARMYKFKYYFGGVRCNLFRRGRSNFERWISLAGIKNFIANSSQGMRHIQQCKGKANVHLLHNGFETFTVEPESKSALRRDACINDNLPIILFVGGIKHVKNPQLLLHAFLDVVKKVKAHLLYVGDGTLLPSLKQEADASGYGMYVHFLGRRPDAFRLMPGADIFCLTSLTEGMAGVLLEAGYAELPLIATSVGGSEDIIKDGFNGYIVPIGSREMLSEKLLYLLTDDKQRKEMGKNSKQHVELNFSIKKMVSTFEHIIDL